MYCHNCPMPAFVYFIPKRITQRVWIWGTTMEKATQSVTRCAPIFINLGNPEICNIFQIRILGSITRLNSQKESRRTLWTSTWVLPSNCSSPKATVSWEKGLTTSLGWPRTHNLAQAAFKLMILLLRQPPDCWGCSYGSPHCLIWQFKALVICLVWG